MTIEEQKHLSYSSLKEYKFCPYRYKLIKEDGVLERHGNIFTVFGNALHETLEKKANKEIPENADLSDDFENRFKQWIENELPANYFEVNNFKYDEFLEQGRKLAPLVFPALKKEFGKYEIFKAEQELYENMEGSSRKFKGFIDLVIKTEDGKYHIIDYKTCSWGWDMKKKSDKLITYQLTLYKNFFCKKMNIDPAKVETHFALIKRTAKKNEVEIFRVTSGVRKTKNALNVLNETVYNIERKMFIKNKLSCMKCDIKGTDLCP